MRADADLRSPRGRGRGAIDDASFTRNMRYEFADSEGRAITWSWLVSLGLGVLWLLLVHILPPVPPTIALLRPEEVGPIAVRFDDAPSRAPEPAGAPAGPARTSAPAPRPARAAGGAPNDVRAIGDAFGGASAGAGEGAMVGDVSNVLRGVDVNAPTTAPGAAAGGGKAVIAYGSGGQGVRTPGRGGLGEGLASTPGGRGLGGVGGASDVGLATVRVAPPSVIRAETTRGPGRNVADLGTFVRGRQSQLQFCYEEYGLKRDPTLAGTVAVAVTLTAAGTVTGVEVTSRTWAGAGASAAEACILERIRGWTFPASDRGGGTYSFSFVFSK